MKICRACEEPNEDDETMCKICRARLPRHAGPYTRPSGRFKFRLNYRLIGMVFGLFITWGISGAVMFRESMADQFAGHRSLPPHHAVVSPKKLDPHQKYRDAAIQVLAQLETLDATRERTGQALLDFTSVTKRCLDSFEGTYHHRPEAASASYNALMNAAQKYRRVFELQTELQRRPDSDKAKEMNEVWTAADMAVLKARVSLKLDQVIHP